MRRYRQQGGEQEQLIRGIMQALQAGKSPEEIVEMLLGMGIDEQQATQMVQMVMQQMEGGMQQEQMSPEMSPDMMPPQAQAPTMAAEQMPPMPQEGMPPMMRRGGYYGFQEGGEKMSKKEFKEKLYNNKQELFKKEYGLYPDEYEEYMKTVKKKGIKGTVGPWERDMYYDAMSIPAWEKTIVDQSLAQPNIPNPRDYKMGGCTPKSLPRKYNSGGMFDAYAQYRAQAGMQMGEAAAPAEPWYKAIVDTYMPSSSDVLVPIHNPAAMNRIARYAKSAENQQGIQQGPGQSVDIANRQMQQPSRKYGGGYKEVYLTGGQAMALAQMGYIVEEI